METVENPPQRRMIDLPHQRPDIAPGLHVAAPGQRFVADPQPASAGALGDEGEVAEQRFAVAQRVGLHVAAQQHEFGAELLHQIELALGAIEVALQALARAALEVAERLEQRDRQAQILAAPADVLRAAGVVEQVVLEQFDAVEAGGRRGLELLRQGPAEGYGGDRALHAVTPVTGVSGPCRPPACDCRDHAQGAMPSRLAGSVSGRIRPLWPGIAAAESSSSARNGVAMEAV